MVGRDDINRALRLWLALLSLHSILLGVAVYVFADFLVRFQGLDLSGNLFYPRQSGAFLVILGVGYGLAAADPQGRKSLVILAIFSKVVAVIFLFREVLFFGALPLVIMAWVVDALQGGVLLILAIMFYGEGRRRREIKRIY